MATSNTLTPALAGSAEDCRVERLGLVGLWVLRYGLVLLLLMWGAAKFAAFEAEAIKPLVENSPFLGWLYGVFGVRGTSALFGVFEVVTGALIATRRWLPRLSGYASLAAAGMFVVTLSFLVTTPGVLEATNPFGGFLMKDIMLLGAALFTAAEALGAARKLTAR
ncbi:MAG: DUF417 family protein [Gemmatimonadaceae bacterium]